MSVEAACLGADVPSPMTLDEYQRLAASTDRSPVTAWYYTLGLAGEGGEVMEAVLQAAELVVAIGKVTETVKKYERAKNAGLAPDYQAMREKVRLELGDVKWYGARLASTFGWTEQEVAEGNLAKLFARRAANELAGRVDRP